MKKFLAALLALQLMLAPAFAGINNPTGSGTTNPQPSVPYVVTSSQSVTVPTWAVTVDMEVIGGGTGGAAGATVSSATTAYGGGSGGNAGARWAEAGIPVSRLGTTINCVIGAGGTAGGGNIGGASNVTSGSFFANAPTGAYNYAGNTGQTTSYGGVDLLGNSYGLSSGAPGQYGRGSGGGANSAGSAAGNGGQSDYSPTGGGQGGGTSSSNVGQNGGGSYPPGGVSTLTPFNGTVAVRANGAGQGGLGGVGGNTTTAGGNGALGSGCGAGGGGGGAGNPAGTGQPGQAGCVVLIFHP